MKHHRHEAEPWQNQSRALAELFYGGNIPPGGGNHHQRSSHWEGVNLHQHLHQHYYLYQIFVPKPQIGTCGLLVVLITPCS